MTGPGPVIGLIQVYTGDGKGKTTAAMGLAVRAAGHGRTVRIIHLMKAGGPPSGEDKLLSELPNVTVERIGESFVYDKNKDRELIREQLRSALELISRDILNDRCDVLILDEINVALSLGLMDIGSVLELLGGKPEHMEVICTGRNAPNELMDVADLVTEVREIKHPYKKGVKARKGIEF